MTFVIQSWRNILLQCICKIVLKLKRNRPSRMGERKTKLGRVHPFLMWNPGNSGCSLSILTGPKVPMDHGKASLFEPLLWLGNQLELFGALAIFLALQVFFSLQCKIMTFIIRGKNNYFLHISQDQKNFQIWFLNIPIELQHLGGLVLNFFLILSILCGENHHSRFCRLRWNFIVIL